MEIEMLSSEVKNIKEYIAGVLASYNIHHVEEDQKLFSSGMLDSLAAVQILTQLEADFNIDLADEDFDINHIDSLQSLENYLNTRKSSALIV
ncbi:MAG TPA: phosphopantetheine-binding protein [Pseudochrobactrum sp.]|nr:phosphopantetheine-binding protein [Pseudochrobactrum sp.]